ncbi:carbon-nitrogen hydrolase family protein [Halorussus limi]|uniref:Carbon-nitrogen hydrolase family protein n=1 Tax=Halorussus limi TaxID=2938695 RepID=A0A8U0HWX7_9EURY|nr:carbon-nitrogen hydrolase family protein [Halorussus limi]
MISELAESCSVDTQVTVFPELSLTGYDLDILPEHAIEVPGQETDALSAIAADSGIDLVVGAPERDGRELYNSLLYISNNGVEAVYRKRRSWGDEADIFSTGTEATTVETPLGKAGFLLCYDLNFPELSMEYMDADCDLLFVSAAWRQSYASDWQLLARARALDNTCYVAAANHRGSQSGRVHAGGSLIAGPRGDVLSKTTDGMRIVGCPIQETVLKSGRKRNPVREARRHQSR